MSNTKYFLPKTNMTKVLKLSKYKFIKYKNLKETSVYPSLIQLAKVNESLALEVGTTLNKVLNL